MYDSVYSGNLPKLEEMPAHHRGSLSPLYRPMQDDQTSNSYFGNSETFSDSESLSRGTDSWLGMVHMDSRPATSCAGIISITCVCFAKEDILTRICS